MLWFVPEQWCADEVAVKSGYRLAWFYGAKLHEGGLVLRFQDEGGTKIELRAGEDDSTSLEGGTQTYFWYRVVLVVLLTIIINKNTAHAKVRHDRRVLLLERVEIIDQNANIQQN